jgi:hypothetical protein
VKRSWTKWAVLAAALLAWGQLRFLPQAIQRELQAKDSFVLPTDDFDESARLQARLSAQSAVQVALEEARLQRLKGGSIAPLGSGDLPLSYALWFSNLDSHYTAWLREEGDELRVRVRASVSTQAIGAASAVARVSSGSVQVLRWESVEAVSPGASER